jgi:flavin reductase (DIM6/NTAB) family NADH-FMN oxidoreductase RutF/effector-binding domain-containing protein
MEKTRVGAFIPLPLVPTVLVGANVDGKPNYLAVGFVSGVNIKPPVIGISLNRKHHTVKGILENGTFSVNIPSADHILETDYCGLVSGRSVDKSAIFSTFYGELKTAPMINELPIVCECRYTGQKVDFAMDTVFFGEVIETYVNSDLYVKGRPADILKINPLLTGLDRRYRLAGQSAGKSFSIGWEYVSMKQAPLDAGSGNECKIVNRSPRHVLFIRCGLQGEDLGTAIGEIAHYAGKRGILPVEGPFILRSEGLEPEAGIRVGFVFKSALQGEGRIETGRIPGGRFAECHYSGPYDKMSNALTALHSFISKSDFKGTGAVYEVYLNDPSVTLPDKLETLILMPIQGKKTKGI